VRLDVPLDRFDELMRKMGAEPTQWRLGDRPLPGPTDNPPEFENGIVLPSLSEVTPGPDGLLTVEGQQVVLYIRDTRQDRETLMSKEEARRFHLVV
jgi:hypothetical protein